MGDEIVILDAIGQLSGSFTSVLMSGFASGAFDVIYDTVNDRVLLRATEIVTAAVPLPGSVNLMLGGLVLLGSVVARKRALAVRREMLKMSRQMLVKMHCGFFEAAEGKVAIAVAGHAGLN